MCFELNWGWGAAAQGFVPGLQKPGGTGSGHRALLLQGLIELVGSKSIGRSPLAEY